MPEETKPPTSGAILAAFFQQDRSAGVDPAEFAAQCDLLADSIIAAYPGCCVELTINERTWRSPDCPDQAPTERIVSDRAGYEIIEHAGAKGIRCKTCLRLSWHPMDVERKYCGCCHRFHETERTPHAD